MNNEYMFMGRIDGRQHRGQELRDMLDRAGIAVENSGGAVEVWVRVATVTASAVVVHDALAHLPDLQARLEMTR